MSVRQSLLALLDLQPMYGYQLRTEFEQRTGATWPLNIGQVYTTLGRLERDGLVVVSGDDDAGHTTYAITGAGREEVRQWFVTPVGREAPPRDELAIKLALAVSVPGVDVHAVVQTQRTATVQALQEYTRLKRRAGDEAAAEAGELAWLLVLDALVFQAEAEVRWLDHCESRLLRAARHRSTAPSTGRCCPHGGAPVTPVLVLDRVARVHGDGPTAVHALRGISLEVAAGELVAVMGQSGSGKSTLLTIAGGLDTPTSGEVSVEGTALSTLRPAQLAALRRRSVGYVFQDFNLIPGLTAAENVSLPLELDGARTRAARTQALAALESVGVTDLADRFPDDMSGGQQQRVAIARAVVGDRRLVLADEPTGALDSETGEAVLRLLRDRVDAGAAGVLVTHEARHAAWADRVVFLRDGRITDQTRSASAPEELLSGGRA